jgi:hypothetical protein
VRTREENHQDRIQEANQEERIKLMKLILCIISTNQFYNIELKLKKKTDFDYIKLKQLI